MRTLVLGALFCIVASFGAVSPVWAKCERLHAEVQARIQEATAEQWAPEALARARQCAQEGIRQHRQGQHWESMHTLRRCLTILE
jgi:hypothetical protein